MLFFCLSSKKKSFQGTLVEFDFKWNKRKPVIGLDLIGYRHSAKSGEAEIRKELRKDAKIEIDVE